MRKIVLLVLISCSVVCASGDIVVAIYNYYKNNTGTHYKIWAVGYCLGYFHIKKDFKFNISRFDENNLLPENIVYHQGVEPLLELTTFIDSRKQYFDKNRPNYCLKLLNNKSYYGEKLESQVERIVKKYCKDCK